MPTDLHVAHKIASPPRVKRRKLMVRGTNVTLLEEVRKLAVADLQFDIEFEVLDFLTCQHRAALDPLNYDIYEQCFHNLDIVWYWGALQPIATERIAEWDNIGNLAKAGGISKYTWQGHGDAPVRKLYVQPDGMLDQQPMPQISMLPTAHNVDSFGFDRRLFGDEGPEGSSWAWLLDRRARGRIALVDEPAIGIFDVALAAEANGDLTFQDIGNMTVDEIDSLMALLETLRQQGFFVGSWISPDQAEELVRTDRVSVQSMWAPSYGNLGIMAGDFCESVPREGYRAWHGGASLARHLSGAKLDMAYEYLNWWLTGPAGAIMARQGHYMTNQERVRDYLSPEEWGYWYDGDLARCDLKDPNGKVVVRTGQRRPGGAYRERVSRIALWNTVMDEYNYAARAWNSFIATLGPARP
ncbi:signal peptide prediction [Thalassovita sp.]|uniref:ABC transporter substrate-binding protein n=1 Tax=Thalassovita sp. TaxID=1979401 RepID=UPI002B27AA6A|nr:signal peptide prediction [Thalassovita sp.]